MFLPNFKKLSNLDYSKGSEGGLEIKLKRISYIYFKIDGDLEKIFDILYNGFGFKKLFSLDDCKKYNIEKDLNVDICALG